VGATVLLVLASLLALLALVAAWVHDTIADTDRCAEVVSPMASDPAVQKVNMLTGEQEGALRASGGTVEPDLGTVVDQVRLAPGPAMATSTWCKAVSSARPRPAPSSKRSGLTRRG
jgi:hypothetical protein